MPSISLYLLLAHTLITSLTANLLPYTNHASLPDITPRSYFTPVREPEMHPVQCHNEADFRGHADIEPNLFFEGVYKFCQERYDTTQVLDATDDPTNAAYDDGDGRLARNASWRYRDWHGVNHDFRVWWEAGCRVTVGKQSVRRPLGEEGDPVWTPGCYEIMGSTHFESHVNDMARDYNELRYPWHVQNPQTFRYSIHPCSQPDGGAIVGSAYIGP
ncbi:hypothetical protein CFIO01_05089 [Colletotrichum fioriniae PJ7]|uniref:Ecp2 effector protein domain-containing protein n=1 Tax=Colletotrichum fioriniae PJ7 TaxID=1445577 RepID=A0A010QJB9_9PEZI|nr:hypothetical protein CFIO01_05089 [Colletotrichum fioriniae PJ7]